MLTELRIENFAIIDHLELKISPGLVIFTGETGAGKSIIIDAVETALGGRAETTMIRTGADLALVEATFKLSGEVGHLIRQILEQEDLSDDPDALVVSREVRRNGRNISRINGRTVHNTLLNEIGDYLVDVHGQSEHLSLLRVRNHIDLLDSYAGVSDLLHAYSQTYHQLMGYRRGLEELHKAESDAARKTDLLKYQINEIELARLRPGEEEELREEHNRLANAEGISTSLQESLSVLEEGTPESASINEMLGQIVHSLDGLARLDPSRSITAEQARLILESIEDLIRNLRNYQETIEFNPKRLSQVEERLSLIHNLKRKYGNTIDEVLAFAKKARQEMDAITHAGERIEELDKRISESLHKLSQQGRALSQKRHWAAQALCKAIVMELTDLNMEGAQFDVSFQTRPSPDGVLMDNGERVAYDANGIERVEFLVAPNPGEGLKPLVKIASGGETSRLMLALKNVLTKADQVPTLVFDEIDQGIGGRVGMVVGQKLWNLARQHQVLCITHLPQLAVFGEQHFHVQKTVGDGRTYTQVQVLHGDERLVELAQMMGEVSKGTRQSAKELIEAVSELTK